MNAFHQCLSLFLSRWFSFQRPQEPCTERQGAGGQGQQPSSGDLAINLTPFIKISAITFSVTHILLGVSFLIETGWRKKDPFILLPVLCLSSACFAYNIFSIPGTGMAVAFGVYLMILSFMLWRAICCAWSDLPWKTSLCVISGAFLFYITDMLVCSHIYRDDAYIAGVWICYPPALFLLSISDWFRKG